MARYIDREKILKYLEENNTADEWIIGQYNADWIYSFIECQPTADVEEVKHGKWIEDGYHDNPCVCSYCGAEAQYVSKFNETFDYDWEENLQSTGYEEIREYIRTPYYPNCGAKMDGGKTE